MYHTKLTNCSIASGVMAITIIVVNYSSSHDLLSVFRKWGSSSSSSSSSSSAFLSGDLKSSDFAPCHGFSVSAAWTRCGIIQRSRPDIPYISSQTCFKHNLFNNFALFLTHMRTLTLEFFGLIFPYTSTISF